MVKIDWKSRVVNLIQIPILNMGDSTILFRRKAQVTVLCEEYLLTINLKEKRKILLLLLFNDYNLILLWCFHYLIT